MVQTREVGSRGPCTSRGHAFRYIYWVFDLHLSRCSSTDTAASQPRHTVYPLHTRVPWCACPLVNQTTKTIEFAGSNAPICLLVQRTRDSDECFLINDYISDTDVHTQTHTHNSLTHARTHARTHAPTHPRTSSPPSPSPSD